MTDTADLSRLARGRRLLGRVMIDLTPLRIRDFRRFWFSTAITAVGSQFSAVAVPKQIFDITGSSAFVGLTGAVGLVVLLVFGLWGGAVADAVDRRKVMIVSNIGVGATSAMLWLQALLGLESVWLILVLFGVQQAFVAVNAPTRTASISRLVPPEQLTQATALSFTVFTFGTVFGPLLAGALIPLLGLSTLYLVDTLALFFALWLVVLMPSIPPVATATPRTAGIRSIVDGFRYLSVRTVLLASFAVDVIAMVAGMPRALYPEMAERTFGDPPGGGFALGVLFAAIPIGAAAMGLLSGWVSRMPRQGVVITVAIVAWGGAMIGFGLSTAIWLAAVFLAIGGAADLVSAVHRGAMLQSAATDEMRGRMQGVFTVVVAGGPRIADMVHGWGGATIGTAATVAIGGALVIVLTVVAVALMPAFWHYRPVND